MNVIVLSGAGAASRQGNGRIGYHNLFTDAGATVTASDEVTGYEKENAYDWKQHDWWKQSALGTSWLRASFASAKSADYMCVFGHNLHKVGGSVKPQYSTDSGSTWNDAAVSTSSAEGNTIFVGFDSVSAGDWRCLVVTTTGQSIIAGIMIGEAMVFERDLTAGFAPPSISPDVDSKTAMSELGVNLGMSNLRTGVSGTIALTNLTPTWVRNDWKPFITHLNSGYPAAFSWDYINYPTESVLVWKKGKAGKPAYTSPNFMSASFEYEGIL
jgi:hypothetical protein